MNENLSLQSIGIPKQEVLPQLFSHIHYVKLITFVDSIPILRYYVTSIKFELQHLIRFINVMHLSPQISFVEQQCTLTSKGLKAARAALLKNDQR